MNIDILVENINRYIEYLMSPTPFDFGSYFANVIAPIVSSLAIVIGGLFALYKYTTSKNYEINLKILNEVYVPLYAYIVKQETFRYICSQKQDLFFDENPILEIKNTRTKQKFDSSGFSVEHITEEVCGCTRDAFVKISEETNFGLASTELITLINMYKMLVYCTSGTLVTNEKAKAIILQGKVERALVDEILAGYSFYHNKLNLRKRFSNIYNISKNKFIITPTITQEEIKNMKLSLSEIQEKSDNQKH